MAYSEREALEDATKFATQSPCQKSKRGVVIFQRGTGLVGWGFNTQPTPFECTGSDACREHCNKLCVHAEMTALFHCGDRLAYMPNLELLHVKVVDGQSVPSGEPSCWQCSRLIVHCGIKRVWLLHAEGLKSYSAIEFHQETLLFNKI